MRCINCRKVFKIRSFGDKHCESDDCKEAKRDYQNEKRNKSTFNKKKEIKKKDPYKLKPINKESVKMKKNKAKYKKVRLVYLEENPFCECGCGYPSTEIHHKNGREGERLCDVNWFMAVRRVCHEKIHANPIWSRIKGYLM